MAYNLYTQTTDPDSSDYGAEPHYENCFNTEAEVVKEINDIWAENPMMGCHVLDDDGNFLVMSSDRTSLVSRPK